MECIICHLVVIWHLSSILTIVCSTRLEGRNAPRKVASSSSTGAQNNCCVALVSDHSQYFRSPPLSPVH